MATSSFAQPPTGEMARSAGCLRIGVIDAVRDETLPQRDAHLRASPAEATRADMLPMP